MKIPENYKITNISPKIFANAYEVLDEPQLTNNFGLFPQRKFRIKNAGIIGNK